MRQSDAFTRIAMRSTVAAMPTSSGALRLARIGLLAFAVSGLLYTASCSTGGSTGTSSGDEDPGNPELADVIYQGAVTDEALEELLAGKAIDNGARAPVVDSPLPSGKLPAATTPTFAWHVGGSSGGGGGAGGGASLSAPSGSRFAQIAAPSRSGSAFATLAELLGPERTASAHGTPVSSTGYWLVFSTDSDAKLLRVFTDKVSYQPDATAWKKLQGAGKTITLTIVAGWFDLNKISPDGGPYAGKPVTFTVTP